MDQVVWLQLTYPRPVGIFRSVVRVDQVSVIMKIFYLSKNFLDKLETGKCFPLCNRVVTAGACEQVVYTLQVFFETVLPEQGGPSRFDLK